ncbi:hypothetical protein FACS189454_02300 [Planctomycetales bacterium]|nr:hypothetical protein FACS189454_02300 [Planctomycetales bacterium]
MQIVTKQVVYYCTETAHIWYGTKIPTNGTPSILIERYYYMLGGMNNLLGNHRKHSEKQYQHTTSKMEWDVEQFFTKESKQILPYKDNTSILKEYHINCPICSMCAKEMTAQVDMPILMGPSTVEIIQISKTNQLIPYCRTCGTVWPEGSKPSIHNHGGKLDFYLAMLGIIRYNEYL